MKFVAPELSRKPAPRILRVFHIAVGDIDRQRHTSLTLRLLNSPDFAAGIPGMKFVEQVLLGKGTKSFEKARIYAGLRRIGS